MKVKIFITLKEGVLDPQGKAIHHSLESLGFSSVEDIRTGKYIELKLRDHLPAAEVQKEVRRMCEKLLANEVIEDYRFEVERQAS